MSLGFSFITVEKCLIRGYTPAWWTNPYTTTSIILITYHTFKILSLYPWEIFFLINTLCPFAFFSQMGCSSFKLRIFCEWRNTNGKVIGMRNRGSWCGKIESNAIGTMYADIISPMILWIRGSIFHCCFSILKMKKKLVAYEENKLSSCLLHKGFYVVQ